MRRKILSKVLAAVLSVAIILPSLSGNFVASAADETTVIKADFSAEHSNWSAIDGTGNDVATFDGQMKIAGGLEENAAYTLEDWPELPLKKVTIEIDSMLLNNNNDSVLKLFYRYNGAEDYEAVQLRNNNSGNWYLPPTMAAGSDSAGGQSNDVREDTFTALGKYNASSAMPSTMEAGATIVLDYTDTGYCKITLKNVNGDEGTLVIKAVGQSFNTNGMQFALAVETGSGATNYANIDSVTFEFDGVLVSEDDAKIEAEAFTTSYATILAKEVENVTVDDKAAVEAALSAYNLLSNEAKALLGTEKTKLDNLKSKISELSQAEGGYLEYDFEEDTDLDDWVALKDGAEGWGIVDNPKKEINTSDKVFLPLANTETPGDKNPWQGGYLFEQGMYPVYTLTDDIWTENTEDGQKLASVSGDLYSLAGDWNNGVMFIYWYQDADNYKAIYIRKENAPDMLNDRTNVEYCYSVRKVVYSSEEGAYEASAIKPGGSNYSTVPANTSEWTHFVFEYAEDGSYCEFTLMDAYGNAETYMLDQNASGSGKTEVQVKLNEGKFAISTMAWALATSYYSYIDNISFNFTGSEKDAAECFKAEYARTIGLDAATVMPEDAEDIEAALTAFGKLDVKAQGFLTVEKSKLDVLFDTVSQWTSDLAESYKKIYATALEIDSSSARETNRTELENAWNVLRRLPDDVQKTLATEKESLETALKAIEGNGSKSPIEIACVGDSITWGSGSENYLTDNWPTQLDGLLGDSYVVRNYGVSGIQAVHIYDSEIAQQGSQYGNNLQLENTRTDAWMTSHINQADVVIIMLGTNDANKVCGPNIITDETLAAQQKECYMDAMKALIRSYQELSSSPTIVLATSPARMIRTGTDYEEADERNYAMQARMYEIQKELIAELGLPYVDIYAVSKAWEEEGTTAQYFNTDALHFTKEGYTQFAEAFAEFFEAMKIGFQTDNGGLTYVYFEEEPTEPSTPAVTGVNVSPSTSTVHVGKTQTFAATVSGTGDYNKNVTWSVSGNKSTNTKIENGTLTVGEDETAETLTITATSVGDSAKSATATVTVEPHDFTGDYKSDEKKHWKECKCGAIAEEADHVMGAWAIAGDNHTRSCVCGKTETESHEYGDWTKVDENQHQRICSVCNAVDKQNHVGADEWQSGPEGHWHECEVCGMLEDAKIAHTPGPEATETTPQTCTVCDYIIAPALGHTHEAEEAWQHDESQHWHECTGCEEKLETADHTYGDWETVEEATETEVGSRKRICTVCGYVQTEEIPVLEHNHVYGEEWKSDGTGHWHVCACGEMDEVVDHTYGEWKVTKEATTTEPGSRERICSVCGYTQVEPVPVKTSDVVIEVNTEEKMEGTAPKTGDVFPVALFVALLLASAAVGTVLVMKKYKRA